MRPINRRVRLTALMTPHSPTTYPSQSQWWLTSGGLPNMNTTVYTYSVLVRSGHGAVRGRVKGASPTKPNQTKRQDHASSEDIARSHVLYP